MYKTGPLDLAEGRVNRQELIARNDPAKQNRHCLAVFPSRMIDGDEHAASN